MAQPKSKDGKKTADKAKRTGKPTAQLNRLVTSKEQLSPLPSSTSSGTDRELITKAEYSRRKLISPSLVSRMAREGKIPTVNGLVDPVAADEALAANLALRGRNKIEVDGEDLTLNEVRLKREKIKAEMEEMELLRRRGELIPVATVKEVWGAIAVRVRQRFLALPSQVAAQGYSAESRPELQSVTKTLVYDALTEITTWKLEDYLR